MLSKRRKHLLPPALAYAVEPSHRHVGQTEPGIKTAQHITHTHIYVSLSILIYIHLYTCISISIYIYTGLRGRARCVAPRASADAASAA